MMTSCYWNWTTFALEVIETQAMQELKYLPPRHFCTVEYPVKLKNNAKWGDVYSRVAEIDAAGTFYVLACKVWDSTGSLELLTTTFLVPCRDPGSNIDHFRADWDEAVSVFIVNSTEHSTEQGSAISIQEASKSGSEYYQDGEDMLDVDCLPVEHEAYLEDQSQYDLGLFAVREAAPIREESSKECKDDVPPEPRPESGDGEIRTEGLLKPDTFMLADDVAREHGSQSVRDTDIDTAPKHVKLGCAEDAEETTTRGLEPTQTATPNSSSSSQVGADSLLMPPSLGLVAQPDLTKGHESSVEELLKPQEFDWANEVEVELENNRGNDFRNLPKLELFNWGDKVEVENGPPSTPQPLPIQETTALGGIDAAAGESSSRAVNTCSTRSSHISPRGTPDVPLILSSDAWRDSSRLRCASPEYTTEDYDCGSPAAQGSERASHEYYEQAQVNEAEWQAENEIGWQRYMTAQYPNIHHFNWLGQPVMERSHTTPEVSLFVILTGPKACLADATRNSVVLKEAMGFIDPVLYAGPWDALSLHGHELLKAITGWVYPFYTAAGIWQEEPGDYDAVEPICDATNPSAYAASQSIYFNGWYSTSLVPVRTQFWEASAQILSRSRQPWRVHQPFRRSPLRKCTLAGSDEVSSADSGRTYFVKGKVQYLTYNATGKEPENEEDSGSSSDSSPTSSLSTGRTTPVSDVGGQLEGWKNSG